MIGSAYFQLRAQLGTALYSAQSLAAELHMPPEALAALGELGEDLREPFLLVVLGEPPAGESTLLDALFGLDLWKSEPASSREGVSIWKYADEARDSAVGRDAVERWRPAGFLRDFTVVTSSEPHALVAERFLPSADLVAVIFSAANPWGSSAWEILKSIEGASLGRAVFVLHEAAGRSAGELEPIMEQLEKTLAERTGGTRPVFAVSPWRVLEAKLGGGDLAGSTFERLESSIDGVLSGSARRRETLRDVSRGIEKGLDEFRARVAAVGSAVEQDDARRLALADTLSERKEQSLRQIGGFLWTLAETYETAQKRGEELLVAQLTLPAMLKLMGNRAMRRNHFPEEVEQRLRDAVRSHIDHSLHALGRDLRTVWQQFHEAQEKGFPSGARIVATWPDFEEASAELSREITAARGEATIPELLEGRLGRMFATTAIWLRLIAAAGLAAASWAVPANFAHAPHAEFAVALAASVALLAIAFGLFRRRRIVAAFRRGMRGKRETAIDAVEEHMRPAMNRFYKDLDSTLAPLRAFCAGQRKLLGSVLERIAQIEATCRRCAAALAELPPGG